MSSTPGNREVAHRLFAAEFEDASYSYSESDEERAPNYVVTPTGARVNRLFACGVLTEVAQAGDSILRARVVDPTGAFVVYAGQYQPEAMSYLDGAETPSFVAVTGKARTFQPEDSDLVYTSVRPEAISEVDAPTRDRWTVTAAERTLERIGVFAAALDTGLRGDTLTDALKAAGVDASLAAGVPIAIERYGTTKAYLAALQEVALDAVRLVADETDEVRDLSLDPGEGGEESFAPVRPAEIDADVGAAGVADSATDIEEATAADSDTPTTAADEPAADEPAADEPTAAADAVEEPADEPVEEGVGAEPADEPVTEEPAVEEGTTAGASEGADRTDAEPAEAEPTEAEPTDAEEAVADAAESVEPDTEFEGADTTEPAEAVDEEPSFDAESDAAGAEAAEDATVEEDAEADAYEMDEETRREVESEFGTDFSTGNEVDPAGEADIETPTPGEETGTAAGGEPGTEPEEPGAPGEPSFEPTEGDEGTEAGGEPAEAEPESAADEEAADADLDTVLLEEMKALDDGDGAPRDKLVARVVERTGADEGSVDDAIQDALMGGQCYEPEDGRLKPI